MDPDSEADSRVSPACQIMRLLHYKPAAISGCAVCLLIKDTPFLPGCHIPEKGMGEVFIR